MTERATSIGRNVRVTGARIAGLVSCVPALEVNNDYFVGRFNEDAVSDVIKMVGVQTRRWVDENTSTRDLCRQAAQNLLQELDWEPKSIDAIIFVSQTPDYRLPATACALHSDLNFPLSCIAFDINLGCSGYPYALWLGMTMVQTGAARRVLLAVGDTISKVVDPEDRSTALLFGDAGTVTALERDENSFAHFVLGTDGIGVKNLIIPEGAFACSDLSKDERLKDKKSDCLFMDGGEIFNFTLRSVPLLLNELIDYSESSVGNYDAFLFHQANLFMIKHLSKKSKLPFEKVPTNIQEYGNTSSASIPLLMTTRLRDSLKNGPMKLAMLGFGVGYSWGACSIETNAIKCIETIVYENI